MADNVNHPTHYSGKYECIDVMIETLGVEAVKEFCIGNAFKYLYRHRKKNGDEDIKKAYWYLHKYMELISKNENTCVSCGASIPEGLQVCKECDLK